jgi:hypothetical protein
VVAVDVGPVGRPPLALCVQRWQGGRWAEPTCSEQGLGYKGRHGTLLIDAEPDAQETYRATIDPGTGSQSDWVWSAAVQVRTPPPPLFPPAAPDALTNRPVSPYAAELSWVARGDCESGAYGIEILRSVADDPRLGSNDGAGAQFPRRVAIIAPGVTKTTIHGLTPGTTYAFSVRAFNPVGESSESGYSDVRLPPGAPARTSRQHMGAFVYGVRLTTSDAGSRDVDYYVACPGGTLGIARGDTDGRLSTLAPPFGDACQAWPPGNP